MHVYASKTITTGCVHVSGKTRLMMSHFPYPPEGVDAVDHPGHVLPVVEISRDGVEDLRRKGEELTHSPIVYSTTLTQVIATGIVLVSYMQD